MPDRIDGAQPAMPIATEQVDQLRVEVYPNRIALGSAAAKSVATRVRQATQARGKARIVFAAAPSQVEFLAALSQSDVDWSRVIAFDMDEYVGAVTPQSFGHFLDTHLFDIVQPGEVNYLDGTQDPPREIKRFQRLIKSAPLDVGCLGIGENGHLAFNDPGAALEDDPNIVRLVELSTESRQQQVNDGLFPGLRQVPHLALTLTVPVLMSCSHISCVVPGPTKRAAIESTLRQAISSACPASILRRHSSAVLYLDPESYGRGSQNPSTSRVSD